LANIKSQKKRVKTNEKAHLANVQTKSDLKTAIKKVRTSINDAQADQASIDLKIATQKLDQAVTKGVIHANQARERKSKLQRAFNNLGGK
jgi:small subunit ribosomal protein S20